MQRWRWRAAPHCPSLLGPRVEALTTLGHPSLDWPSTGEAAATAAVTVFAGGTRPITLGYFIRVRRDPSTGALLRPTLIDDDQGRDFPGPPHYARDADFDDESEGWYLRLALAWGLDINDDRDKLPPVDDGYIVRLLVGADDGKARTFTVHIGSAIRICGPTRCYGARWNASRSSSSAERRSCVRVAGVSPFVRG